MRTEGKVIVVTGAGSGMGREAAIEAIRRGASVASVDLNAASLQGTADRAHAPGQLSTHVVDVAAA